MFLFNRNTIFFFKRTFCLHLQSQVIPSSSSSSSSIPVLNAKKGGVKPHALSFYE